MVTRLIDFFICAITALFTSLTCLDRLEATDLGLSSRWTLASAADAQNCAERNRFRNSKSRGMAPRPDARVPLPITG